MCTGDSWEEIGQQWDIPRLNAWNRARGILPPLDTMIAAFLGYELPKPETERLSVEEHGKKLVEQLMGFG